MRYFLSGKPRYERTIIGTLNLTEMPAKFGRACQGRFASPGVQPSRWAAREEVQDRMVYFVSACRPEPQVGCVMTWRDVRNGLIARRFVGRLIFLSYHHATRHRPFVRKNLTTSVDFARQYLLLV